MTSRAACRACSVAAALARGGWSVVVLRAGERLGASWSADVSACAVCICGDTSLHKSPRRRLCVTRARVRKRKIHRRSNRTADGSPRHHPGIHGPRHARRRATKTRSPGEARTPARDISATRECTPPRRTSGSAAATARTLRGIERVAVRRDETTFTCFTNGNLSGFVTCMPVAPTSPAGALREIWPRSHLWLARLGLSRWACSCRCAWPTRGCLRP